MLSGAGLVDSEVTIPQFVILPLLAALVSGVAEERVERRNLVRKGSEDND
jgi:hypothetical protein